MKILKHLPLILPLLLLIGCGGGDDSKTDDAPSNFQLSELLTDATNTLILPAIEEFNAEAKTFSQLTDNYLSTTTTANLTALRNQFIKTALAYEKTYVFHIGTARDRFLHRAIYNWPTVASALEGFIADSVITEETVAAISPQIKAMAGIEYLLFKGDLAATNTAFTVNPKRREYLRLSMAFLSSQADRLLAIWDKEQENYATTFITNEATGIRGSFNLFFNGINNAVDTGKVTKIGKPSGLEKSDAPNPELLQAPFSEISLELLQVSIAEIEKAFFAKDITNIADYIFFVLKEDSLNQEIQQKIDQVQQAMAAIDAPLATAITSNPAAVANLHTKLRELGVLLTVDARSALSIIITATDNDGD